MYFASIKAQHKYSYFADTFLCYSCVDDNGNLGSFNSSLTINKGISKSDKYREIVYFWDTTPNVNHLNTKEFQKVINISKNTGFKNLWIGETVFRMLKLFPAPASIVFMLTDCILMNI